MFSFLKFDPVKTLKKKHAKLLEAAVLIQRSGDLKLYASKMEEIEQIELKIAALKNNE
jgi:hypothetical protein